VLERHTETAGPTRALAELAVETPPSALPDEVLQRLRRLMLDWTGITAFAAHHAENAPAVRAAVARLDAAGGHASAVALAEGRSPLYAALLNGTFAHSMDFDDTNIAQIGHPGSVVIAAALADAERLDAEVGAFYEAVAVGYEVCCRIGAALGPAAYDRGFHMTAVSGIFGAVAAAARLRALSAEVTMAAFGLALSKAAGSMQYLSNGSWNKRLHPGFAAHDGLMCTELAQAGVTGAAEPLEGRYGLLHSYSESAQPALLTDGLGESWMALQTAIKPYPSCRLAHGAVDATLALREQVPAARRPSARIGVRLSPPAFQLVGERVANKLQPAGTVDAQFSVYFQVAMAWLDGRLEWASYERIGDDDMVQMASRVSAQADADVAPNGAVLTVELDGGILTETVSVPLGEPGNWIEDDGLRTKFRVHAGRVFGDARAEQIADSVLAIEPERALRELAAQLRLRPQDAAA
jgi:2-methylcitrate dehydratase PrpD